MASECWLNSVHCECGPSQLENNCLALIYNLRQCRIHVADFSRGKKKRANVFRITIYYRVQPLKWYSVQRKQHLIWRRVYSITVDFGYILSATQFSSDDLIRKRFFFLLHKGIAFFGGKKSIRTRERERLRVRSFHQIIRSRENLASSISAASKRLARQMCVSQRKSKIKRLDNERRNCLQRASL